jgi:hypothetical protein
LQGGFGLLVLININREEFVSFRKVTLFLFAQM